jgi:sigma-54 specific flagellar transcriptional regulator A
MADSLPRSSFLGTSPGAVSIRQLLEKVATSNATVLINGESGTGKELVARTLHEWSDRRGGHFVPINCGAIPKELLESELFGHRKGSFTGASTDRMGRFELAHGGTIFLDEIGDMPMEMQVKLLRVLQERTVGGAKPVPVDVRVVAATHRDLEAEIAAGRFREDLFYRLNVLPVFIPPLRERMEDVPELLSFYANKYKSRGQAPISFAPDFLSVLTHYAWPGNVRELSNLVDRFTALFSGMKLELSMVPASFLPQGLRHLQSSQDDAAHPALFELNPFSGRDVSQELAPAKGQPNTAHGSLEDEPNDVEDIILLAQGQTCLPPDGLSLKDHLADVERNLIAQALERSKGNVSQTARLLNLQRTTLIVKLDKYDLRYNAQSDGEGGEQARA